MELESLIVSRGHGHGHGPTGTVAGNLLDTKVLTLVSRQLGQPVQSPSDTDAV